MKGIVTSLLATMLMAGPVLAADAPAGGAPPSPTKATKATKTSTKGHHAPTHMARSTTSEKAARPGKRSGIAK
jgi:hypothetical protein